MLIIVVHGLRDVGKVLCTQHPGISQRVILVENAFREAAFTAENNFTSVYFNDQAAAVQYQGGIFVMIQNSCLLRAVIMDHLSCFHAVFLCQAVVAAYHVRAGFFGAGQHFFVHIRCNPVVAVDKANPFPRCQGKAYVFGASLFPVYLGMDRMETAGVVFFKLQ